MADIDWQLEDLTAEYHHNAQQLDNAADELRSAQQQFQRKLEEKAAIVSQLHREADLGESAPQVDYRVLEKGRDRGEQAVKQALSQIEAKREENDSQFRKRRDELNDKAKQHKKGGQQNAR